MKRKVIFLAGKTGVISLPINWLKSYDIKKGEELEITEILDGLLVSKPQAHPERKIEMNITNINQRLIYRYLNSFYRQGYTEIKLFFENNQKGALESIQKGCDSLIGIEIVKSSQNYCILKEVSNVKEGEFETLLRRIFLILLSTSKDLLNHLETKDISLISSVYNYLDPEINRLFNLCQRIIAIDRKYWNKVISNTLLTEKLERIGDLYSEIARAFSKEITLTQTSLEYFSETNSFLERFYNLFYKYKSEELNQLHLDMKKLKEKINSLQKDLTYQDIILMTLQKEINNQIREAIDDLINIKI